MMVSKPFAKVIRWGKVIMTKYPAARTRFDIFTMAINPVERF